MTINERPEPRTIREAWAYFKDDMQNPIRRKIRLTGLLSGVASILRAFLLIGLCFIILMPFIQKISYSFRYVTDTDNPLVIWIPETWSIVNFKIGFECLQFKSSFWVSLILSGLTTVLQVLSTAIAGYAFARLKFKGSNIFFYIVLFSLVVPDEALKGTRSLFFSNNRFLWMNLIKLSNYTSAFTPWQIIRSCAAVFIMSAFGQGLRSSIFIYLFRQFFRNVPIELEESAQVDGASVTQTFWKVMFPNARGTIITVALFSFVWQYNDSYYASIYGINTIATRLANISSSSIKLVIGLYEEFRLIFGPELIIDERMVGLIGNTCALIMMVPLLIGYFFVQRLFVESIERTGLTGM